ncbi:MAG: hypothetical protein JWM68_2279 [Verrucomicrobiales bacterium]|nr:hypothetical protein [Verrucomicrobiales bacterium]
MKTFCHERWSKLWQSAGVATEPLGWFDQLSKRYAEPQRHYHNVQHINECLREFDSARHLIAQPLAVEMAIWFHDAIYDPRAPDNEERSADLAKQCLSAAGIDRLIEPVSKLILATKHHVTDSSDGTVLLDIDLSILGQPEERFFEYEKQIRREYEWVPEETFGIKRAEILQNFLNRPRLYTTDLFFSKYERQARLNLEKSIRILGNVTDGAP